jgi:outer membrane protein TolC
MKRVTMFLAVVFAIGLATARVEAKVLTLDDCIEIALEKRASIIQARGSARYAGAEKLSALGAMLPSVSAGYGYSRGKETNIENPTSPDKKEQKSGPSKTLSLSLGLSVFDPANWFSYAAASAAKASAELDVLASEQDLIQSVKIAYYAYLAAQQNLTVQEEAAQRAEEQLKLIQSRYELGSASKSDVLKQKVQFGTDQLALLRAKDGVVEYEASLAYTIGLDPREKYEFSADYRVQELSITLDEAIGVSLTHNPSLLAGEKSADQAKHNLRAAKSNYLPTLSVSYDMSRFNGTLGYPNEFDYSSHSRDWGFRISYPIFNGFVREQQVTAASVSRNNALAQLADTRNFTVTTVKTTHFEVAQLGTQREVSQENVAAAEEDLRITQEKYNLGAATILDLLNAQVSLKEAQVALIQVQFDLNLAIARLENAMGKM